MKKVFRSIDIGLALEKATGKKMDPPRTSTPHNPEVAKFLSDFEKVCEESRNFSLQFD